MGSAKEYRVIAQDCLRMAVIADDERDRPLWVTMAQSWIQLAEHVARLNTELESEEAVGDSSDNDSNGSGDDSPDWSQTSN